MYASVADLRELVGVNPADPTDAQIIDAISQARERIDKYTSDTFEPVTMTALVTVGADGVALLPRRMISVAAVEFLLAPGVPLAASQYLATSSGAIAGQIDQLVLYGNGWGNVDTIVGLESWNRDTSLGARRQLLVTGSFGWSAVPDAVHDAAVLLAVAQLGGPGQTASVNAEGDADLGTPARVPELVVAEGSSSGATTGHGGADALLSLYTRALLRVS